MDSWVRGHPDARTILLLSATVAIAVTAVILMASINPAFFRLRRNVVILSATVLAIAFLTLTVLLDRLTHASAVD